MIQPAATLYAGDTLEFTTTVPNYPPADGWTLKYRLIPRVSGTPILLTATTSGADYLIQQGPATTVAWAPGLYSWAAWVEKSGARHQVDQGQIEILPDPSAASSRDDRSDASVALENVRAMIGNKASRDVQEYQIAGRALKHYTIPDLIALESKLKIDVANEQNAAAIAAGSNPRLIRVRFQRG
jgi:hypothetical protein